MFTGIIRNLGTIESLEFRGALASLIIQVPFDTADIQIGDSIAINGVCLTVARFISPNKLAFDLGPETLEKTTLSRLRPTQRIHLERAMCLADRLDGHLVQGHVDGVGIITEKRDIQDATILRIAAAKEIMHLCISKGSITVDGVSLTINALSDTWFEVCLVPLTIEKTCFGNLQVGDKVNIETDMIGRYIKSLVAQTNKIV